MTRLNLLKKFQRALIIIFNRANYVFSYEHYCSVHKFGIKCFSETPGYSEGLFVFGARHHSLKSKFQKYLKSILFLLNQSGFNVDSS